MIVSCTCTYQTEMQQLLSMRIFLASFNLWYLKLTLINVRQHAFVSLGNISLTVAWFCIFLSLQWKCAFEASNSWNQKITIISVHFLCYLSMCFYFYFFSWACNKIVNFFVYLYSKQINCGTFLHTWLILSGLLTDLLFLPTCIYYCVIHSHNSNFSRVQHPKECWTNSGFHKETTWQFDIFVLNCHSAYA